MVTKKGYQYFEKDKFAIFFGNTYKTVATLNVCKKVKTKFYKTFVFLVALASIVKMFNNIVVLFYSVTNV